MKAFTVYQPYAFAIVAGLKHYETRPRPEQREAATQSGGVMLIAGDESGPLPPEFVDFIKRRFE